MRTAGFLRIMKKRKSTPVIDKPEADGQSLGTGSDDANVQNPAVVDAEASEAEAPVQTVESLQVQVAELTDRLLRCKAELANLQRRAITQRLEAVRLANVELLLPFLSVADDFERSLSLEVKSDEAKDVLTGVRLVYENLMKAFRDHGLTIIEAVGKPFDPNFHEAAMRQPSSECPPDTVLQEVARGYQWHDRVIRPTKVIVSSAPADEK